VFALGLAGVGAADQAAKLLAGALCGRLRAALRGRAGAGGRLLRRLRVTGNGLDALELLGRHAILGWFVSSFLPQRALQALQALQGGGTAE
jgi:hypothetical protein